MDRKPVRCYTTDQILEVLQMPLSTFTQLKNRGKLPWLVELKPRAGRRMRFRADLVDRYLAGQWGTPRAFPKAKSA